MANKLSLEFEAKGAEAAASKVDKLANSLDALKSKVGKSGQTLDSFIASFPPAYRQQVMAGLGIGGGRGGGGVPPIIPPPILGGGGGGGGGGGRIGFGNLALGLAAGLFSPFAGARILSGEGGGGGGGFKQIINALFGGGGPGAWAQLFVGLQAATRILRFEFEALTNAIKQGSKLFQDAALAGRAPHSLFALQAAGRSIGISGEQVNQLAYNANLFRPGRVINASGQLVSAAQGMGQAELGTRILQGKGQFESTLKTFEAFQDDIDDSSKSLFYFMANVSQVTDIIKGGLIIAVGDLAKWFNLLGFQVQTFAMIVPYAVKALEQWIATILGGGVGLILANLTKYLPTGADLGKGILPPGAGGSRPESGWEKMGLIIQGGVNAVDYARQTAENTKKIADAIAAGKGPLLEAGIAAGSAFNSP